MSTTPATVKQEFQSVLCDMCLDSQMPALKTCLKCEISMCAQHLQAHLTTPVLLQTHPLTKPVSPGGLSSGAVIRCPEHGKVLEYYCLDDRTCVCVSCSIEDQHRLHNLKTLSSAQKVLVEKLKEEKKELSERQMQGKALKSWETKQRKALEESSEHLVKAMLALRNIGLTKVASSVSARLDAIQAAQQSIEAALSEEDAHQFLQRFADVHETVQKARAVDFIHGLEENAKPEQVVFDLLKNGHEAVEKVLKLQRDLLTLVDPEKQFWGTDKPTDMIIDQETVGQHFLVSTDFKTLSCCSPTEHVSQRVYFKNSTDCDLHWTMDFSEECSWSVGLCGAGLPSRLSKENTLSGPLYGLEWKNKQFFALHTKRTANTTEKCQSRQSGGMLPQFHLFSEVLNYPLQKSSTRQGLIFENKLEVLWNNSSKSLFFFTRGEYGQIICLHSVGIDSSLPQKLLPFVTLEKKEKGPSTGNSSSSTRASNSYYGGSCSSCPKYADFVCAVHDEKEYDPPSKKRKVI
ncbi:hypothetical protein ACEWY4_025263 [Coilia grayii]|uniref:B box-type domain-containing protein n=1 Tax=Coilia grayii TaxID=363190 RepID=A0ABD1IXA0_9TELE